MRKTLTKKTGFGFLLLFALMALIPSKAAAQDEIIPPTSMSGGMFQNLTGVYSPTNSGILTIEINNPSYLQHELLFTQPDTDDSQYAVQFKAEPTADDTGTIQKYDVTGGETYYFFTGFLSDTTTFTFSFESGGTPVVPQIPEPSILSMEPADGSSLETLMGQTFIVTFDDMDQVDGYTPVITAVNFSIYADNAPDPDQAATAYIMQSMTKSENVFTKSYDPDQYDNDSAYFFEGMTYSIVFDVTVSLNGQTKIFKLTEEACWTGTYNPNSDVTAELISVDPESGTEIPQMDQEITLTFSEPVKVTASKNEGNGASSSLTCTGSGDNSGDLYTVWSISVPKAALTGAGNMQLQVSVIVTDANGNKLNFPEGPIMVPYLGLTYPIFGAKEYKLGNITIQTPPIGASPEPYSTDKQNPTEVTSFNLVNVIANSGNPVQSNLSKPEMYQQIAVFNAAGGLVTKIDIEKSGLSEEDGKFYIYMQETVEAQGLYYMFIPEAALDITADQGETTYCNETTIWFVIGEAIELPDAPEYSVNPANESTVEILQQISVDWGTTLSNLSTSLISMNQVVTVDDQEFSRPMDFTATLSSDNMQLLISPANSTAEGVVEIIISEGAVNMTVDGMLIGNQEIELTYTVAPIEREEVEGIVTELKNEDGDAYGWSISWGEEEIEFANVGQDLIAMKGLVEYNLVQSNQVKIEDNALVITLTGLPTGSYTLNIPERYILIGSTGYNGSLDLEMTLEESVEPETPETPYIGNASVNLLVEEEIGVMGLIINWSDYSIRANDASDGTIVVSSSVGVAPVIATEEIEDNSIIMTFENPIVEVVPLTISIPQGYVYVGEDGSLNEAQTLTITTTGVEMIGIDTELNNVYTLQGVKINASKVSQLPAGLYIINGKKVIVK